MERAPQLRPLATVLGVRPAEPSFKSVRIAPHLGPSRRAEGRVPHPRGEIVVRSPGPTVAVCAAEVTLPEGLAGVLAWEGKEISLRPGRQEVSF
jgi:hypothetical protein